MRKLSVAQQQMFDDGCPLVCLKDDTAEARAAADRVRSMVARPPEMRLSNPPDQPARAHPAPPPASFYSDIEALAGEATAPGPNRGQPMERPGVKKKDIVAQLLLRKEGCTVAEVLAATGWTKVGMPTMAEAAGLKLRKVKDADTTRYFGSK